MKKVSFFALLTVALKFPIPTNAWTKAKPPILIGPDAVVPLLLQCFEDGGYPCSGFETVAVAYRDRDTESRLGGVHKILSNEASSESNNSKDIEYAYFKDGKIDDDGWDQIRLSQGYGEPDSSGYEPEPTNDFLMYCCFRRQFIEGDEGGRRMLRGVMF